MTIGRFWLLLIIVWIEGVVTLSPSSRRIAVCQNKHCSKRNPNLLQTISNLVSNEGIAVESSGCLSHCEDGPNVEIHVGDKSQVLNEMVNAATVAVQLELNGCCDSIPKLLRAASNVMDKVVSTPGK